MRPIPSKHKRQIDSDPYFKKCARANSECQGRITIEHAFIYASKQIAEMWNYVPLCAYHHAVDQFQDGGDLDKEENQRLALARATDADLAKYNKRDWQQLKQYLENNKDHAHR